MGTKYYMTNNIKARTALVTGGSKGIGAAIGFRLIEEGVSHLILVARSSKAFTETVAELKKQCKKSQKITVFNSDLADSEKTSKLIHGLMKDGINVDILVNNAGFTAPKSIFEASFEEFQRTIQVNLYAPFLIAQILLQGGNKFSHIFNIASTAGIKGRAGWATYSSSKAALIALSQALREELLPLGTRVTCISPGRCATALRKVLAPEEDPSTIMQPEHVADVMVTLLSDVGHFIDSENIVVRL